jgi:hypothetical protein
MSWDSIKQDTQPTEAQLRYAEKLLEERDGEVSGELYKMSKQDVSKLIDELTGNKQYPIHTDDLPDNIPIILKVIINKFEKYSNHVMKFRSFGETQFNNYNISFDIVKPDRREMVTSVGFSFSIDLRCCNENYLFNWLLSKLDRHDTRWLYDNIKTELFK